MELLLASKSPRRHYLLKESGFDFKVVDIDVEEDFNEELKAQEIPLYLCEKKSKGYTDDLKNKILITADTIVWLKDKVPNKPADINEAKQMLQQLSGNMHQVYTAVCMRSENKTHSFFEETKVYFKTLTESQIDYYLEHFKPLDKAGAYGIQEWIGYIGIEKIEGCYYNVMGFPVSRFYDEIRNNFEL
ncbi:MAG: septum formation protein Maf [Bacteroidia bacterium]|nr:septum formation protein Maf [Bacteroidia bacterium]